jgi:ATPase subunit of ABC transporter with duplicated ATPase domains
MITVQNLSVAFGSQTLFEEVDVKFTPGNCYGLIGAERSRKVDVPEVPGGQDRVDLGSVSIEPNKRLSMLSQDHFAFNEVPALTAVIMGHQRLHALMVEKDALYAKPDFSEADGVRAGELEAAFADLNGWDAEAEAAKLLSELGVAEEKHRSLVKDLPDTEKVRVLMAQALFGNPDILLLDEPTNHLDVDSILWLEEFLLDFPNIVVVVSHDRHFLDKVCTHIADIDFGKVTLYSGNYTFWYETSQMALAQRSASNKKKSEQIDDLKAFIARFSANASKSRQASSRKKLLDKITLDDIRPSNRKYPFIQFKAERALGKDVVTVEGLRKTIGGEVLFDGLSFSIGPWRARRARRRRPGDLGPPRRPRRRIQARRRHRHLGTLDPGRLLSEGQQHVLRHDKSVLEWLRQYAPDTRDETFIRSFLGRMLFTSDEVHKKVEVLSGGERVRCMLSRLMLKDPNTLLLNQPTNHLDLESITALNNGLLKSEASMIFSCHDVQFVESLANRVIELSGDDLLRPPHELPGLSRRRCETGPGRPGRGVSPPIPRRSRG